MMNNQAGSLNIPTTTAAISDSESLARDIKEGVLSGFIGNGIALTGQTSFKGMLRVDGILSGRISSEDGTLIVSTNGLVEADVEVAVAQIHGTFNGEIIASQRIEIGRAAKVTGSIHTPTLVMEEGAVLEGRCRMTGELSPKQAVQKKMRELGRGSTISNTL